MVLMNVIKSGGDMMILNELANMFSSNEKGGNKNF